MKSALHKNLATKTEPSCTDDVTKLEREIASLRTLREQEAADVEKHKSGWDREMSELRKDIIRREQRCNELEIDNERLKHEGIDYCIALHKGVLEASGYRDQIEQFKHRISHLSDEVAEYQMLNWKLRAQHAAEMQRYEQMQDTQSDMKPYSTATNTEAQNCFTIAHNRAGDAEGKIRDLTQEIDQLRSQNTELEDAAQHMRGQLRESSEYWSALKLQSTIAGRMKANYIKWEAERDILLHPQSPISAQNATMFGSSFQSPARSPLSKPSLASFHPTPPRDAAPLEDQPPANHLNGSTDRELSSITSPKKSSTFLDKSPNASRSPSSNATSLFEELAGIAEACQEENISPLIQGQLFTMTREFRRGSDATGSVAASCGSSKEGPSQVRHRPPSLALSRSQALQSSQTCYAAIERTTQTSCREQLSRPNQSNHTTVDRVTQTVLQDLISRSTQTTERRPNPYRQEGEFVDRLMGNSRIHNADAVQKTVRLLSRPQSPRPLSTSSYDSDCHPISPSSRASRRQPPPPRIQLPVGGHGMSRSAPRQNEPRPSNTSILKREEDLLTPSNLVPELRYNVKGFIAQRDGSSWIMDLPSLRILSSSFRSENVTTPFRTGNGGKASLNLSSSRSFSLPFRSENATARLGTEHGCKLSGNDCHTISKTEKEFAATNPASPTKGVVVRIEHQREDEPIERMSKLLVAVEVTGRMDISEISSVEEPNIVVDDDEDAEDDDDLPRCDPSVARHNLFDQQEAGTALVEVPSTVEKAPDVDYLAIAQHKRRFFEAALAREMIISHAPSEHNLGYFGSTWNEAPLRHIPVRSVIIETLDKEEHQNKHAQNWQDHQRETSDPGQSLATSDRGSFFADADNEQAPQSAASSKNCDCVLPDAPSRCSGEKSCHRITFRGHSDELRLMWVMLWINLCVCLTIFAVTSLMFLLTYEHRQAWFNANHSRYRAQAIHHHHSAVPRNPLVDSILYWVIGKCGLHDEVFGFRAVNT